MSNYVQTTLFAPKDTLPTGNPAKTIFGAAYDVEFGNIATAIASKPDNLTTASFLNVTVTGSSVPANGIYLPSANTLGLTANTIQIATLNTGGTVFGGATGGAKGAGTINATGLYVNGTSLGTGSANPSASVGLSAVNGTATTFMTSDSAPALSQSISPTWTGNHNFSGSSGISLIATASGTTQPAAELKATATNSSGTLLFYDTTNSAVRAYLGSGAVITGMAVSDFGLAPGTSGNVLIGRANGTAIGTSFGPNGNITVATPSSGNTVVFNLIQQTLPSNTVGALFASTSKALRLTATANQALLEATDQTGAASFQPLIIGGSALALQISATTIFQVNGTSSPTLQGYGPTAAGLVDMTPDSSTFTITYTGMTAGVTGTAVWSRNGNQVMLFLPAASGTSNNTTFTATGIPNAINPTRAQNLPLIAQGGFTNNSTAAAGSITVNTNNTLTFGLGAFSTAWTASGTKGVALGLIIYYLLN